MQGRIFVLVITPIWIRPLFGKPIKNKQVSKSNSRISNRKIYETTILTRSINNWHISFLPLNEACCNIVIPCSSSASTLVLWVFISSCRPTASLSLILSTNELNNSISFVSWKQSNSPKLLSQQSVCYGYHSNSCCVIVIIATLPLEYRLIIDCFSVE